MSQEPRIERDATDSANPDRDAAHPEERLPPTPRRQPPGQHSAPSLDALAVDPGGAATLRPDAVRLLLARCGVVQNTLIACLAAVSDGSGVSADDLDRLLPVPLVAELLAVPVSYAYELARQGKLPTVRLGKYVRVRSSALSAWLDRQDRGELYGVAARGRSLGPNGLPTRNLTPKARTRLTPLARRECSPSGAPRPRRPVGGAPSLSTDPSGVASDDT